MSTSRIVRLLVGVCVVTSLMVGLISWGRGNSWWVVFAQAYLCLLSLSILLALACRAIPEPAITGNADKEGRLDVTIGEPGD